MDEETGACVAMTTCGSREAAEALAEALVRERLAACVQLLPMTSFYEWEGQVQRDPEVLLLVKTTIGRYPQVEDWIRAHHDYDLPEILRLPVSGGLTGYLEWLATSTRPD
jgi:periplasmic divalent cation tolerance protein